MMERERENWALAAISTDVDLLDGISVQEWLLENRDEGGSVVHS